MTVRTWPARPARSCLAAALAFMAYAHGDRAAADLSWGQVTSAAPWIGREDLSLIPHDGRLWMMGGYNDADGRGHNDVWYSTNGAAWTIATSAPSWQARWIQSVVSYGGRMWLIGGYDNTDTYLRDVWVTTNGADWAAATTAAPWMRRGRSAALVHDAGGGPRMYIVGGLTGSPANDVWWSTDGAGWTVATNGAPWIARWGHDAVSFNGQLWVLGGVNGGPHNDVWSSVDGASWTQATAAPGWRKYGLSAVAYDGRMYVMGGYGDGAINNDVWSSTDGASWTQEPAPWAARANLDSVVWNGNVWLAGGSYPYRNDVWTTIIDSDTDGVADDLDNCPMAYNPDQANNDGDAQGDACDPDDDDDGVLDASDNCQFVANAGQGDCDTDAVGDACVVAACQGDPPCADCQGNGVPDGCEIGLGVSADCNADQIPDECEGRAWIGPDGGSFGNGANWTPGGVPITTAVIWNSTPADNTCALDTPGETGLCEVSLGASGSGLQTLRIGAGNTLRLNTALGVETGGRLRAMTASRVLVGESGVATLAGEMEVRSLAAVVFDGGLTCQAGGRITLLDGTLAASSLVNQAGATIEGTGTIDGNIDNLGQMIVVADMLVLGDLENDGTIVVQSGILTVLGNVSGTGTIIGGFGG